jgi:hypothetical protein
MSPLPGGRGAMAARWANQTPLCIFFSQKYAQESVMAFFFLLRKA